MLKCEVEYDRCVSGTEDLCTSAHVKSPLTVRKIIIIMCIYRALINALSIHMIHVNLNVIFYTHVEHSPTKTIKVVYTQKTTKNNNNNNKKQQQKTKTKNNKNRTTHIHTHTHTHPHTHAPAHSHTHTHPDFTERKGLLHIVAILRG